jgi:hypothetical protein
MTIGFSRIQLHLVGLLVGLIDWHSHDEGLLESENSQKISLIIIVKKLFKCRELLLLIVKHFYGTDTIPPSGNGVIMYNMHRSW